MDSWNWFSTEWFRWNTLMEFHWVNKNFLFLIILIPFLFLLKWILQTQFRNKLILAFPADQTELLRNSIIRHIPFVFLAMSIAFILISLARPQRASKHSKTLIEGIDILLAMDISESMNIIDLKPDRLQAAQEVASAFIEQRSGDRIGLIVFGSAAIAVSPITTDHQYVKQWLKEIKTDLITGSGTAIGTAIATGINYMRDSGSKSKIMIDHYLADIDLRNNKVGEGGIKELGFDSRVPNMPQWTKQKNYHRPDVWYNNFDGLQLGWHLEGDYLKFSEYEVSAWVNTGLLQNEIPDAIKNDHQWVAFAYKYRSSLFRKWKGLSWYHSGSYNASILNMQLGIEKEFRKQDDRNPEYTTIYSFVKYLYNDDNYQTYLLYPNQWGQEGRAASDYLNATSNLGITRHYKYEKGNGIFDLNLRAPFIGSDYNYSRVSLNSINSFAVKKLDFRSRVFAQWGVGNMPLESQLYLAGASPEELVDNKFFRAKAIVPNDWTGYGMQTNHFQYGGGLNLRGYAGYLATDKDGNQIVYNYKGNSGAAWNLEMDFDRFVKIKPKKGLKNLHLDTYLFTDLGLIAFENQNTTNWSKFRMDAGIGTALTLKFSYFNLKPLVLRFDMPLFLNSPPAEEDYFQMRYVFSINRAF